MMGQRIKDARIKRGLKQVELAEKVGVVSAEISQYESGKRTPRWDVFLKLIDELNVSADYLIGREITIVADNEEHIIRLAKIDIQIISAIKNYPKLYKKICTDIERNVKSLNNEVSKYS